MRKWVAIALLLVLVGCAMVRQSGSIRNAPATALPVEAADAVSRVPKLAAPRNIPSVNQQRLMAHLQALVGERYSESARDRARTYLVDTLKENGWTVITQPFEGGVNVVARQTAKPSLADTVMVVAHYDTVAGSPGADDNATGVAVALEVARLLRTQSSNHALAIALFDQEEQGLKGSLTFASDPSNLNHLIGVINLEMMGYTCNTPGCQTYPQGLPVTPLGDRGDFLGVVGDLEHDYLLQAFRLANNPRLLPLVTVPVPFKGLLTPDVLRSDHAPFWARNIGAVMVGDTANFRNPHYHQPTDTADTLDLKFLTQATQLVVNATAVLLDSTQK